MGFVAKTFEKLCFLLFYIIQPENHCIEISITLFQIVVQFREKYDKETTIMALKLLNFKNGKHAQTINAVD